MKMKMQIAYEILEGVLRGFGSIMLQKIESKLALKIARVVKILQDEYKTFEEIRIRLCEKHALKTETGEPIIINDAYDFGSNKRAFEKEFKELLQETVEIEFSPILLVTLENEGIKLTPADMLVLGVNTNFISLPHEDENEIVQR